jgi:hypothetical protein
MKTCSKCDQEKPLDQFSRKSNSKDGLNSWCRQCNAAYCREWADQNRTILNENAKMRARANPEENRERVKQWRKANPEKARENARKYKARRRERELAAGIGSKRVSRAKAWEDQNGVCPCGEPIDRSIKHPDPMSPCIDHIVPLVAGGKHTQENIQWMHFKCNALKGVSV